MSFALLRRIALRMRRALPVAVLVTACATLPQPSGTPPPASQHLDGAGTSLAAMSAARAEGALRVLDTGVDAFLERAALIESAERAIDAQYYIWNTDATGSYLARRIHAAAERGVQVRILLDDINVGDRDAVLSRLDQHPNVEIRIFNPFARRSAAGRMLNFLGEFARLNRRMHNKSFTVDGSVTIIGGRNIGDEYFDAAAHLNFRDREVVATGPVVGEVGSMFDTFWNSALSIPIATLAQPQATPAETAADIAAGEAALTTLYGALPQAGADARARVQHSLGRMLQVAAQLVYDPPPAPDAVAQTETAQHSAQALFDLAAGAREQILIESAYLVMDEETTAGVTALRERGIRVRALTNSLASNDVTANHAAYARVRERMLEGGVELHELRPDAPSCRELVRNPAACGPGHVFGLHSKTFVLDNRWVYVGSLNLNLRSRYLNAESGLVIDSPEVARAISASIVHNMNGANSWRVELNGKRELVWRGVDTQGAELQHTTEPDSSWKRRLSVSMIAMWPLEKYL